MPVGPGKQIQLGLLTVPKDCQGQKTHQVRVELGKQCQKGVQKILLAMDEFVRRYEDPGQERVIATAKMPSLMAAKRSILWPAMPIVRAFGP